MSALTVYPGGFTGQNTDVDAAAERLIPTSQPVGTGIIISNPNAAGVLYIGFSSSVSAITGFPIAAGGQQSVDVGMIPGHDATNIYIIGSTTNLIAAYMGV